MAGEVVVTGLEVPEGPVVLPGGRVAFVQQVLGRISVFDGSDVDTVAEGPGAWNSVTYGADGMLYAPQNGGVVGAWRAEERETPSIQRISFDGAIETLVMEVEGIALKAPNDLVFGPDGRLYFTDPSEGYDPENPQVDNHLFAVGSDGGEVLIELPPSYTNGIAFTPDGRLCWVESYHRTVCLLEDGKRRVLATLPEGHVPDGLDVAQDGRLFIATVTSHGITVISPEGEVLDHLLLDDDALVTNCCFDAGALWATDFGVRYEDERGQGRLWRVETDAIGKPQTPGSFSRSSA